MHQYGSIVRWDAARGFGFIRSAAPQADVFFHVRDFRGAPEPTLHMDVEYEEIHVGGKGPRAMAVRPLGAAQPGCVSKNPRTTFSSPSKAPHPAPGSRAARPTPAVARATGTALWPLLVLGWVVVLGWGIWSARLPLWYAGALLAVNLLTLWTYAADKNAARTGTWRVSENQLHLLSLLGGWPAAWLAQQNLRHKTSKASFRALYWLTIVLHCSALALWLWRSPVAFLF